MIAFANAIAGNALFNDYVSTYGVRIELEPSANRYRRADGLNGGEEQADRFKIAIGLAYPVGSLEESAWLTGLSTDDDQA